MRRALVGLLGVLIVTASGRMATAGPYSPDPAFGGHGFVATAGHMWHDVAVLGDGRVVVVGDERGVMIGDMAVGRFLADGTPDPTFDGDGLVTTGIFTNSSATAVAVQSDGKIVVVAWVDFIPEDAAVIRYLDTGALDPGFGTGGVVRLDIDGRDIPGDVAIQPDGKIVVVGVGDSGLFAVRLETDGTPDGTFGVNGVATHPGVPGGAGLALQPDGKIVTSGSYGSGPTNVQAAVVRLLDDGMLDAGFGTGGIVLDDVTPEFDSARAVAVRPDGRIVAGGFAGANGATSWLLLQLLDDGTPDTTFGTAGVVMTPMGSNALANDLALMGDGRLVLVGQRNDGQLPFPHAVVRYDPGGTIDPGFGIVTTDTNFGGLSAEQYDAVAIAPDGDIVAAGYRFDSSVDVTAVVARYGTPFPVCWDGVIDAPEQCDDRNFVGGDCCSATCQLESPGSPCASDGDPCTTDACDGAGTCTHPPGNEGGACDDGDVCTVDACQGGICVGTAAPAPVCKGPVPPSRGWLVVDTKRDRLNWGWRRGEDTQLFLEDAYTLCLYDSSAQPQPLTRLESCVNCDPWTVRGSQPIYVDDSGTYNGITRMYFTPGADERARFTFRARGATFPAPTLPLVPPVTAQLHGAGQCWSATFSAPRRSDADIFRSKPD